MDTDAHQVALPREHHFYAAIAKFVFTHSKHGVVFVRDPIALDDARKFGLTPLILYGITVPGTQINWFSFSPAGSPRSFCSVLQEAWRMAPGLRGRPDTLKVARHVASASPSLANDLAQIGVKVVVADSHDKQFPSSLRSAQINAMQLGWCVSKDYPSINSIATLQEAVSRNHQQSLDWKLWMGGNKETARRCETWLQLTIRSLEADLPTELDWTDGPWLASWQSSLPPAAPRYLSEIEGTTWLVSGQPEKSGVGVEESEPETVEFDDLPGKAKLLVDCWPNKPVVIAKALDITARELRWFLTGRAALPRSERFQLLEMLGLEYRPEYDEYEASGNCILLASTLRAVIAAYDELSLGGDIQFSFEALPTKVAADPSWRYLLFQAWGQFPTIIMIPRGSKVGDNLDKRQFINFSGQRTVPDILYRDIVSTCSKGCLEPMQNRAEMLEFLRRHSDYLAVLENHN